MHRQKISKNSLKNSFKQIMACMLQNWIGNRYWGGTDMHAKMVNNYMACMLEISVNSLEFSAGFPLRSWIGNGYGDGTDMHANDLPAPLRRRAATVLQLRAATSSCTLS